MKHIFSVLVVILCLFCVACSFGKSAAKKEAPNKKIYPQITSKSSEKGTYVTVTVPGKTDGIIKVAGYKQYSTELRVCKNGTVLTINGNPQKYPMSQLLEGLKPLMTRDVLVKRYPCALAPQDKMRWEAPNGTVFVFNRLQLYVDTQGTVRLLKVLGYALMK